MNCEILHTLYVRSNGDVPCNDDAGERVLLGKIPPPRDKWTVNSLLSNHNYREIRAAFRRGTTPWPDLCPNCAFFRPHEPFVDHLAEKRIRKLQIEPSLACALRCPSCSNQFQVRVRPPPFHMDLGLFDSLLAGLAREMFSVAQIEYCGQGEPLQHPGFSEFVRCARGRFPVAMQRLITSGNFDYATTAGRERLDEIIVSCDGVDAESYARYRVGGHVLRAIQFMRDALRGPGPPLVIWKYILFEWNDSPDEIFRAQQLAQELGVGALLFVCTHSKGKSRRYASENGAGFPLHFSNVVVNATPIHYQQTDHPVGATPAMLAG